MIKEFVEAWDKNKDKLREVITNDYKMNDCDYKYLVKLLFEYVVNPAIVEFKWCKYDTDNILVIDDGYYQGVQIFILHQDICQPYVNNYIYTSSCYGSCSGCDTLLAIQDYNWNKLPTKEQVNDYMTLCLHLLQSCKRMEDCEYY